MMTYIRSFAAAFALFAASFAASAMPINQLGLGLDGSGSIGLTEFQQLKLGMASAISALPLDGSVEITVVVFSNSATLTVSPTILTAATLPTIVANINAASFPNSTTNTAAAINLLTNAMTNSAAFGIAGSTQSMNIGTDGVPFGGSDPVGAAQAASAAAQMAGIDSLSFEAIGDNIDIPTMQSLAFPGPVSVNPSPLLDPSNGSWVVTVADAAGYAAALDAKLQAIVNPMPEPGIISMLGIGFVGFAAARRRRQRVTP